MGTITAPDGTGIFYKDWSQFYQDLSGPFYGANRPGSAISSALREWFWQLSMQVELQGAYDCVEAFSETDLTEDLKKIDVPVLLVHGDDDQIVPLEDSSRLSAQLIKDATLKIYPGAPHGLANTSAYKDTLNADLLAFLIERSRRSNTAGGRRRSPACCRPAG